MSEPGRAPAAVAEAPPGWRVIDAAGAYVVGILVSTVVGGIAAGVTGTTDSVGTTVAGTMGLWVGFAGVPALIVARRHLGPFPAAVRLRARAADLPLGLAAGAASSVVLVRLVYALLQVTGIVDHHQLDKIDDPAKDLFGSARGVGTVALVVVVVVGAPIVEEIFFRGFLQRALVARLGPGWGIGATAVVFGITHFEALQFAGLVAFGAVLGVLAHRTRRLGPNIAAHMTFNAITVAVLLATR